MPLSILDEQEIEKLLIKLWQKKLNTTDDPTNGMRWLKDGPNNDKKGLIGDLTDSYAGPPILVVPVNPLPQQEQAAGLNHAVNNINGLTGPTTVILNQTTSQTITVTHITSHEVKVGLGIEIKFDFGVPYVAEGGITGTFSVDYTYHTEQGDATATSDSLSGTTSTIVSPPAGKVYLAVMTGGVYQTTIPYTVDVLINGITETWFENPVDGHYNYFVPIGSLFDFSDDPKYVDDGNGQGRVKAAVQGHLTVRQTITGTNETYDITNQVSPGGTLPILQPNSPRLLDLINKAFLVSRSGGGAPAPPGTVVVYDDSQYGGYAQTLGAGSYDWGQIHNDTISSVKVAPGMKVTLYSDTRFQGKSKTFTQDEPYVGDDINDQTSSIRVEPASGGGAPAPPGTVVVYDDSQYGGYAQTLGAGSYDWGQIHNDTISSVKVAPGMKVTLYSDTRFQGKSKTFTQDEPYVGDDINDQTSSIRVEPASGGGAPAPPGTVVVYDDSQYGGYAQTLGAGSYDWGQIHNDTISSVKVAPGMKVTLYSDTRFQGKSKTFTQDEPYVGDDINDQTSSIRVEPASGGGAPAPPGTVVVYDDSQYGGYAQTLGAGSYDWGQIHNDTISSVKVAPGMKVTLYSDTRFQGKSKTFTQDEPYVGDDINDQTSSIRVEKV